MLHRIYSPRAAVSANPCLLRELHYQKGFGDAGHEECVSERERLIPRAAPPTGAGKAPAGAASGNASSALLHFQPARRRADSPPRGHFHVVSKQHAPPSLGGSACTSRCTAGGIQLTLNSLQFGGSVGSSKGRLR